MEFHRGRLIDHVHFVVCGSRAQQRLLSALCSRALGRELSGEGSDFFFADELFVSAGASPDWTCSPGLPGC